MVLILILLVVHTYNINQTFWCPNIEYNDVMEICKKEYLTEDDYLDIFNQTGVSPYATKKIIEENRMSRLSQLNSMYLKKPEIKQKYLCFPITSMDYMVNQRTPLVNIKNGDILINFDTYTLDWRHGHVGLVVDAENNKVLEHAVIGETSYLCSLSSWSIQPKFVVLRFDDEEVVDKVVEYAKSELLNLKYSIFVGVFGNKDKSKSNDKFSSNCSHIIWQAFKKFDIDLDSNGGNIVTPKDIALSNELKVVQIYGINTKEYIDRLLW